MEETTELKARLEALEQLLGKHGGMPAGGLPSKREDAGPAPPRKRVRIASASDLPNRDTNSLQAPPIANTEIQAFGDDLSRNQNIAAEVSGSTFGMASMMDQPLIFDFDASPYNDMVQTQERGCAVPVLSVQGISPRDLGHGTLVMSKSGGSSKYYGHTAASEWLKDVCHAAIGHWC